MGDRPLWNHKRECFTSMGLGSCFFLFSFFKLVTGAIELFGPTKAQLLLLWGV